MQMNLLMIRDEGKGARVGRGVIQTVILTFSHRQALHVLCTRLLILTAQGNLTLQDVYN